MFSRLGFDTVPLYFVLNLDLRFVTFPDLGWYENKMDSGSDSIVCIEKGEFWDVKLELEGSISKQNLCGRERSISMQSHHNTRNSSQLSPMAVLALTLEAFFFLVDSSR